MVKEKCCGTIIIDDNKVLMIKQTNGYWGFPKGHVEDNETEEETALRETKEETNLDVEIINDKRYINSYTMENGISKDVIFFLAKLKSNEIVIQEEELLEYKWVSFDKVTDYFKFKDSYILWEEVLKDLI